MWHVQEEQARENGTRHSILNYDSFLYDVKMYKMLHVSNILSDIQE